LDLKPTKNKTIKQKNELPKSHVHYCSRLLRERTRARGAFLELEDHFIFLFLFFYFLLLFLGGACRVVVSFLPSSPPGAMS
jgi:hypothetical protein